jgi:LacI family transcriptional regulator
MKDVAERAGVSSSTVSLVLSGKHDAIPVATRERVMEAAAELGYRRNVLASGLRRQASDTIGVVSDLIATTPHAGAMVQGVQDAAWQSGKVLLMVNTGGDEQLERRAIDAMLGRQVEGLLYATMYHRVIDPPETLREVPSVLLDARSTDQTLSSVAPDEQGGAQAAVAHLAELGHRRIGFLQSSGRIPAAGERLAGYRSALAAHGLEYEPALVARALDEHEGGLAAATELLARPDRPTALFCFNDRMAAGAVLAARRLGLSVPNDVSLVGFDNEELVALLIDPPLTTVQLPHYDMGRWAMEHLLELIGDPTVRPEQYRMPCRLVVRSSAARPS